MFSRLEGVPKRSIALVEQYHDEMLLALRSAAGHTITHGHIGPLVGDTTVQKNIGLREYILSPEGMRASQQE